MRKPAMVDAVTLVYALKKFCPQRVVLTKSGPFTRVEIYEDEGGTKDLVCWLDGNMTQMLINLEVIAASDILTEKDNG